MHFHGLRDQAELKSPGIPEPVRVDCLILLCQIISTNNGLKNIKYTRINHQSRRGKTSNDKREGHLNYLIRTLMELIVLRHDSNVFKHALKATSAARQGQYFRVPHTISTV
jgi:hypothetical protein